MYLKKKKKTNKHVSPDSGRESRRVKVLELHVTTLDLIPDTTQSPEHL